jgi:hypothetical protein
MIGDRTEAMVSDKRAEQRLKKVPRLDDQLLPACIGHKGPVTAPTDRCMSSIVEKCVQAVGDDSPMRLGGNRKLILQVDRLISRQAFEEDIDVQC